ncbi:MAG TPA: ATP-binding protein [Thermoanaerobaculia bacterium]|nr:ATP-binding protein [Thermoanaerobaculia bacterium]
MTGSKDPQEQKMEALGILAAGVAHDFNNLVTAILGYTDILTVRLPPESDLHEEVSQIRKATESAASLTRQLMAFARRQKLEPEILDLNEVVFNLRKIVQRLVGETIDVHTLLDGTIGAVRADAGQIEQVILNLAVNARDAMPVGGTLTIETCEAYLEGPCVLLCVTDTGTGMDTETKARVFEPFFTTKKNGKGTGLGLATVYGIVEQSGGRIVVQSDVGLGTTFEVYLPRVMESPRPS